MQNSDILFIIQTYFSGKNILPPKVDWAPTPMRPYPLWSFAPGPRWGTGWVPRSLVPALLSTPWSRHCRQIRIRRCSWRKSQSPITVSLLA